MAKPFQIAERRTSADAVFDFLHQEITSLRYLPGTKISEVDIASRFGVSRQPVRDAFSRLGNLGLLQIRPQKATEVKRFSNTAIATARFVRASVEAEVLRRASRLCGAMEVAELRSALLMQKAAVDTLDVDAFHRLDYDFHHLLCRVAEVEFAFGPISENKAQVDRLCVLSLMGQDEMTQLLGDHSQIVTHVEAGDAENAVLAGMHHLSRLDATIDAVRKSHPDYFED